MKNKLEKASELLFKFVELIFLLGMIALLLSVLSFGFRFIWEAVTVIFK